MDYFDVRYPQSQNMFDNLEGSIPLRQSSDHGELSLEIVPRDGWNVPKYVSKASTMKQYHDQFEEIPLRNRFSCLGNVLPMERCKSPPLIEFIQGTNKFKPFVRDLTPSEEVSKPKTTSKHPNTAKNTTRTRGKSMCDLRSNNNNENDNNSSNSINNNNNNNNSNFANANTKLGRNRLSKNMKKHNRHKSMTDMYTESNAESKAMDKKSPKTKSMENLNQEEGSTKLNKSSIKRSRKGRRTRKDSCHLNALKKSLSTPDLSNIGDSSAMFPDQSYTDFSEMLKTVKQTLNDIMDKGGNSEGVNDIKDGVSNDYRGGNIDIDSGDNKNSERTNREYLSESTDESMATVEQSLSLGNTDSKIPKNFIPVDADVPVGKCNCSSLSIVETIKISQDTQTESSEESLVEPPEVITAEVQTINPVHTSSETQTFPKITFQVSIDTQTVCTECATMATQTMDDDVTSPCVSTATQTENILSLIVAPKEHNTTISLDHNQILPTNGNATDDCYDVTDDEGHDYSSEEEGEGEGEVGKQGQVTPSKWLASMGMHKLCIFSQKDIARIKAYDYFLPQLRDFDPNLVVVHIGMMEFPDAPGGSGGARTPAGRSVGGMNSSDRLGTGTRRGSARNEAVADEVMGVGEAIMKVVEICSDYGVRNVAVCNVKNRSTTFISERRSRLKECLISLCKREKVRFKTKGKIYFQRVYPDAVKLSVPDHWLCSECTSDDPWQPDDRKRVREEVLKCYDQISLLESNNKDAEKEISALRSHIQSATIEREITEKAHKKEIMELRCTLSERTKDLDMLRTNLRFR